MGIEGSNPPESFEENMAFEFKRMQGEKQITLTELEDAVATFFAGENYEITRVPGTNSVVVKSTETYVEPKVLVLEGSSLGGTMVKNGTLVNKMVVEFIDESVPVHTDFSNPETQDEDVYKWRKSLAERKKTTKQISKLELVEDPERARIFLQEAGIEVEEK